MDDLTRVHEVEHGSDGSVHDKHPPLSPKRAPVVRDGREADIDRFAIPDVRNVPRHGPPVSQVTNVLSLLEDSEERVQDPAPSHDVVGMLWLRYHSNRGPLDLFGCSVHGQMELLSAGDMHHPFIGLGSLNEWGAT